MKFYSLLSYFALAWLEPSYLEFTIQLTEYQKHKIEDLEVEGLILNIYTEGSDCIRKLVSDFTCLENQIIFILNDEQFSFFTGDSIYLKIVCVDKSTAREVGRNPLFFLYSKYIYRQELESTIYFIEDYTDLYDIWNIGMIQETIDYIYTNNLALLDVVKSLISYRLDDFDKEILGLIDLDLEGIFLYVENIYNIIINSTDKEYVVLNQFLKLTEHCSMEKTDLTQKDLTYSLIYIFYKGVAKKENRSHFCSFSKRGSIILVKHTT